MRAIQREIIELRTIHIDVEVLELSAIFSVIDILRNFSLLSSSVCSGAHVPEVFVVLLAL